MSRLGRRWMKLSLRAGRIAGRCVCVVFIGVLLAPQPLIALDQLEEESAAPASVDSALPTLDVQSAFITLNSGVYQLFARVLYPLDESTRSALRDGTSVAFVVDIEVSRARRFWLDAEVLSLSLKRELSFQSVTGRYVVRDPLSDMGQLSFTTLDEALDHLGKVDAWPILVTAQIPEEGEYSVRVRANIRLGPLTDALRTLMFWSDDFERTSEWNEWSLQR